MSLDPVHSCVRCRMVLAWRDCKGDVIPSELHTRNRCYVLRTRANVETIREWHKVWDTESQLDTKGVDKIISMACSQLLQDVLQLFDD